MVAVALPPGNRTSINVLQRACMHHPSKVRNASSFIEVILLTNRNKREDRIFFFFYLAEDSTKPSSISMMIAWH